MDNDKATDHGFDYDVVVIGGGSGGLAASREMVKLNSEAKIAVLDYVKPSPAGTQWGLGGTCVNVGCIPKKLFHTAALHGEHMEDAKAFGWEFGEVKHNWETLVSGVADHIGGINWGYRVALRSEGVTYINAYGRIVDANTVETENKRGEKKNITARRLVIATGGRPRFPDIPGAKEYGLSSDDIFSKPTPPGKTLVVGASYVALECAGYMAALGYDVSVMMRSIPLRGFDQQMAGLIVKYMEDHKTKFIKGAVPSKVEEVEGGQRKVTWTGPDGESSDVFDTVFFAIGRTPCTSDINIEAAGVELAKNGKIITRKGGRTNVDNIYALGDVVDGNLELTPVAIKEGHLLAERFFGGGDEFIDPENIPTTVFTPLEYGVIGLSEEDAEAKYGKDDLEIYHSHFQPLEWTVPHREENACYTKLVCVKSQKERVVGFHFVGPNAGEVTQGLAVAMRLGATKKDISSTIGIHPTVAEEVIVVDITKASGKDPQRSGC